jgi:O-antigen ligase
MGATRSAYVFLGCGAVLFCGLLFNGSRGAVLALLIALAIFLLLTKSSVRMRILGLTSALLFLALPGVAWTRLDNLETLRQRGILVRDALIMALDAPLTGIGLGAFSVAYPPYQSVPEFLRFHHVECEPVEWFVEGGLPLLIIAILLVLAWRKPVLRALSSSASSWLARGLGISVIFVFVHATLDFPLRIPGVLAGFAVALVALGRLTISEEAS